MNGMEGAVDTVVERFTTALPAKTGALRTRYGINPVTQGDKLPDVVTIDRYNRARLGVEEWPAVLVSGLRTETVRRVDQPNKWLCQYRLRAFVWVRGQDGPTVELVLHRLTLGVRELLLERRTLPDDAMVDDSSLVESYSELARDDNQQTVAGSYIEFLLWVEETLTDVDHPPFGDPEDPNEVEFDTSRLPPHPAM